MLSVFSLAFNQTLGDQEYTKQTISEAGFYSAVGETIVLEAVGEAGDQPLISTALEEAVGEKEVRAALEPLIDGSYAWLEGETQQPEFSLEIAPVKKDFEQNLTEALQAQAASLPACTSFGQLQGTDIFDYTCIPPGTDVDGLIADIVTRVSGNASVFSDEIVADGTVSAEEAAELGVNDPTQNLPEELPRLYQFMTAGLLFFIAGTLITGVGVVFLSKHWLYGMRKLGVLLLLNGIGVLIAGFVLSFVVSSLVPTTAIEVTEASVNALEQAAKTIFSDNASFLKIMGVVTMVLGLAGTIASTVLLSKDKKPGTEKMPDQTNQQIEDSSKTNTP